MGHVEDGFQAEAQVGAAALGGVGGEVGDEGGVGGVGEGSVRHGDSGTGQQKLFSKAATP